MKQKPNFKTVSEIVYNSVSAALYKAKADSAEICEEMILEICEDVSSAITESRRRIGARDSAFLRDKKILLDSEGGAAQKDLAKKYNVSPATICRILAKSKKGKK